MDQDRLWKAGFFVASIWEVMNMQGILSANALIFLHTLQPLGICHKTQIYAENLEASRWTYQFAYAMRGMKANEGCIGV